MKLIILLLTIACVQVSANSYGQYVTIEARNKPFKAVLAEIRNQTGIDFIYNTRNVNEYENVNLRCENMRWTTALEELLSKQKLQYKINDNTVLIQKPDVNEVSTPTEPKHNQQELAISGRVLDANRQPIAGVSLSIKGSSLATSTNNKGHFSFNVPRNSVLVIKYIGYLPQEKLITDASPIEIILQSSEEQLDEVVVIGYGTQSRKESTGSLTSVKGDDINSLPVQSFDAALGGRSSGVQISANAGVPNQAPVFKIRGTNSLSLSTYPLVVIDGVPAFDTNDDSGPSYASNNPLSAINPADIESIDIAKDAAATSIYGSRAANGVVFITTKKGKRGSTRVNYEGWYGINKANRLPKMLNAAQYVEIKNEGIRNDGSYNDKTNYFSLNKDKDGNFIDTDWNDYIYRTGQSHSHALNISGATDKTNYYGSISYANQEGIFQRSGFERKSAMFNIDNKTTNWMKVGAKLNFSNENNLAAMSTGTGSTGAFQSSSSSGAMSRIALISAPVAAPYNNDGSYNTTASGFIGLMDNEGHLNQSRFGFYNPVISLDHNRSNNHVNNIQSNAFIQINPLPWISFKSIYGIDYRLAKYDHYLSPLSGEAISTNGSTFNLQANKERWVWTNTLNIDKKFDDVHRLGVLLGQEQQRTTGNQFGLQRTGQSDPYYTTIQGGWQNVVAYATGNPEINNYLFSLFSRVQYDYKKKYYLTANLRQDEYSALGLNNKKGVFWGVSAGWDITKEDFWKDASIASTLTNLKLRGSYGKVGNVGGLTDFGAINTYSANLYGGQPGLTYSITGNPDLKWETSKKLDIGLDFGLFGKITGEIGYYRNTVDGLIIAVPLPPSAGIPNATNNRILQNVGEMYNQGIELTLNTSPITNDNFTWNTSFNFTTNKNEVKNLANGVSSIILGSNDGLTITMPGQSAGMLYVIETAGVDPATGRQIFLDGNGNKVLYQQSLNGGNGVKYQWEYEDGSRARAITPAEDAKPYRNVAPKVFGGWSNSFNYKGIELSALITYQFGGHMMNGTQGSMRDMRFWNNSVDMLDRWQKPGDNTDIPRLVNNDNVSNGNTLPLSKNVSSTDFIRLKNVMIAYNFSSAIAKRIGVGNLRAYVSGQNLAMWTKYTGFDPEVTTFGNAAIQQGIDKNQAPNARTYTVGLSVGF